jgi:hypothetical protein
VAAAARPSGARAASPNPHESRVSIFSVVSIANGPMDDVGSAATAEAGRDARGGGLPVRSSRNNANSS